MNDQQKLAFEFARDTTTQLITLSTAIVAVTVTFWDHLFSEQDKLSLSFAVSSWVAFLISIFFGIWTLLALTGTLESPKKEVLVSIRGRNVTLPSLLQIFTFILALVFTVVFGIRAN